MSKNTSTKPLAIILGSGPFSDRNISFIREFFPNLEPLLVNYGKTSRPHACEYLEITLGSEITTLQEYIKKQHTAIALVINRSDSLVSLQALIVDSFAVPGPSGTATRLFRDKGALHTLMIENGLGEFRPETTILDLKKVKKHLESKSFPVIVKPYMGAHSRGVMMINSMSQWKNAHAILKNHFESERSIRFGRVAQEVLIEQYLDGKMIVPVCYVDHEGNLVILAFNDIVRGVDVNQPHMQLLYRQIPSHFSEYYHQQVHFLLQKLITLTGLRSTFLDPELMIYKDKLYVIEINVRGGGFRYETLKHAFGVNMDVMALNLALGKRPHFEPQFVKSCTACEVWEARSGKLLDFSLPKSKNIVESEVLFEPGETYEAPPTGNTPLARYYVVSQADQSLKIAKAIRNKTTIVFE